MSCRLSTDAKADVQEVRVCFQKTVVEIATDDIAGSNVYRITGRVRVGEIDVPAAKARAVSDGESMFERRRDIHRLS